MKICSRCNTNKSLGEFLQDQRYHLGVTGWCRACKLARGRERASEIKELHKRIPREKLCRTCGLTKPCTDFSRAQDKLDGLSHRCKECRRHWEWPQRMTSLTPKRNHLWTLYGMTLDDAQGMLESQGGKCAICESELRRINIDHCHATGRVRGILCFRCNTRVGTLEDDQFIERAKAYLSRHRANVGAPGFFVRPAIERRNNRNKAQKLREHQGRNG